MAVEGLQKIIEAQPLFTGLGDEFINLVTGCARNVRFSAGDYLMREGDAANDIFLIREGQVALEISAPGAGHRMFQSIGPGGMMGISWMVPPYHWAFDARARTDVRAISFDANCLRGKLEADPALGYEVMKRVTPILVERLHNTRLQMLDIYGPVS